MSRRSYLYLCAGLTVAVLAFAGFARSYYLRALFSDRTLTPLLHVHGILMTAWIALFICQASLILRQRPDLHRRIGAAGIAGYFLDHDARSLAMISRVFDGRSEGLTRDDVLDNVTLAWLTNTAVSAGRLYWEAFEHQVSFFGVKGVSIPVAVSVFPDELYQAPRSWSEQAYPKLMHYNKVAKGGHFAAWEQPKLVAEEVRAGFRPLQWNR